MELGFRYERQDGTRKLIETKDMVLKRIKFLRAYMANLNADPAQKLTVLFQDETWNYQNGNGKQKQWQVSTPDLKSPVCLEFFKSQ